MKMKPPMELPVQGHGMSGTVVMRPLLISAASCMPCRPLQHAWDKGVWPGWMAMPKLLGLYLIVASTGLSAVAAFTSWLSPPLLQRAYRHHTSSTSSIGSSWGRTRRQRGREQQQQQQQSSMALGSAARTIIGDSPYWLWLASSSSSSSTSGRSSKFQTSTSIRRRRNPPPSTIVPCGVQNTLPGSSHLCCGGSGDGLEREDRRGDADATEDLGSLLSERLGMSLSEVQHVQDTLAAYEGLGHGVAAETVAFFCGGGLDLTSGQMRALVKKAPHILGMSAPDELVPQADRWLNRAGLGLTRKSLGRMAVRCPEVFLLDYDSVLEPIVVWLMVDVRVARNRVARFLEAFPYVLADDLAAELRPRHRWLMESLQLLPKDGRRLLSLAPELLHASMEETLLPACNWLMAAGQCDMAGVGRISTSSPELLLMEPIVMQGCLSRMADEVFDGDEARASALFGRQPVLLAQSHRLRPLVRLLVEELKATLPEAIDVLANDPSILEFQVESVVLPRLEAVREAGIGDVVNGAPLPLKGKIKVLGKFSEARFAKWLKREGRPRQQERDIHAAAAAATATSVAVDTW